MKHISFRIEVGFGNSWKRRFGTEIILTESRNAFAASVTVISVVFIHVAYYGVNAMFVATAIRVRTVDVLAACDKAFLLRCSAFATLTAPALALILVIARVSCLL